jgi:hypothetical protein
MKANSNNGKSAMFKRGLIRIVNSGVVAKIVFYGSKYRKNVDAVSSRGAPLFRAGTLHFLAGNSSLMKIC